MRQEKIEILSCLTTGFHIDFENIKDIIIQIDDSKNPKGGFGQIFPCVKMNQKKTSKPILIKIYLENNHPGHHTIQKLQKCFKLKQNQLTAINSSFFDEYPALIAAPLFSFEGKINNEEVKGYGAYDLKEKGYVDFKDILEGEDFEDFRDIFYNEYDWTKKFKMAYDLVNAINFLWNLRYIHADIKADAIFININTSHAAFIDYDSGAFFNTNDNNKPATFGAAQDWLAPEIRASLSTNKAGNLEANVNIFSDTWSINVMLYYIFFGFNPYYFLNEMSDYTLKNYFNKNKWPNFDSTQSFINKEELNGTRAFQEYCYNELPKAIQQSFELTFNEGYFNKTSRCDLNQWVKVFRDISTAPRIIEFKVHPTVITNESEINFSWQVENHYSIYLEGNNVSYLNEISLPTCTNTTYILEVRNYFGKSTSEHIELKIDLSRCRIKEFRYSRCLSKYGSEVCLKWQISGYKNIWIDGGQEHIGGSIPQIALKNKETILVAKNIIGKSVKKLAMLRVLKQPELRTYKRPLKIRQI
ncbi:serine/threonine-protein kinase [Flavivirga aquimarina]|uniref:Serine/threonine-protein kinase n=1 Tax=Flavivirga aquimarina TaxID=2027862 RepID=A0ABT8W6Y0_9FLAO|nr:serine/threonine-protein kinase [Flavivirga aquimarina]MDO5968879.1 serine/threonine-protein kinase [Flavivirga aquimarina]